MLSPQVSNVRFYIAKLIEEISAPADPMRVIHRSVSLIYANSEQDAFDKALAADAENAQPRHADASQLVRIRFWGLGELNVIHDDPQQSAEFFQEESQRSQMKINSFWQPAVDHSFPGDDRSNLDNKYHRNGDPGHDQPS